MPSRINIPQAWNIADPNPASETRDLTVSPMFWWKK